MITPSPPALDIDETIDANEKENGKGDWFSDIQRADRSYQSDIPPHQEERHRHVFPLLLARVCHPRLGACWWDQLPLLTKPPASERSAAMLKLLELVGDKM